MYGSRQSLRRELSDHVRLGGAWSGTWPGIDDGGRQRTPREQLSYRISAKPDPLALDKHKRLFPLVDILERASRLASYRFSPGRCHPEFIARAYGLLTHRPIIGLATAGIRELPWPWKEGTFFPQPRLQRRKGSGRQLSFDAALFTRLRHLHPTSVFVLQAAIDASLKPRTSVDLEGQRGISPSLGSARQAHVPEPLRLINGRDKGACTYFSLTWFTVGVQARLSIDPSRAVIPTVTFLPNQVMTPAEGGMRCRHRIFKCR